jgi:hypothetical protein
MHVLFTVSEMAFPQLLLEGGAGAWLTQILNEPLPEPEK